MPQSSLGDEFLSLFANNTNLKEAKDNELEAELE